MRATKSLVLGGAGRGPTIVAGPAARRAALAVALAVACGVTAAQELPPPSPAGDGAPTPRPSDGPVASPTAEVLHAAEGTTRVVAVHRLLVERAGDDETAEMTGAIPARPVGLGAVIAVEVTDIESLLDQAGGLGGVVLFLDGIPLPGLAPIGLRPERGWLIFDLERTERADQAWHLLLGSPSTLVRRLSLAVGPDESQPVVTAIDDFPLAVIHPAELTVFLLSLLGALVAFLGAARRTDLLRDRAADVPPGGRRPYSLARCQMAWWFFLVVSAYLFIWLAIDELDTITPSILALIGIGSATALGAGLIDGQKKQSRDEAEAELGQVQAAVAAPTTGDPAAPVAQALRQAQAARLEQRVADLQGVVKAGSRGFWRDLLWDAGGISLHRFQIAVWTLVLGAIFVASVYGRLTMPEFSATLLGLMGISSGTYLGFKFPERQSS